MTVGAVALLLVVTPISLITWLICLWTFTHGDGQEDLYYPISPTKLVLSLFLPLYLAYNGLQKKRLTFSGALAAMFIGWTLCLINYCFLTSMLAFYYLSSKATKFRLNLKLLERDTEKDSTRTWANVMCNGAVAVQISLFYFLEVGCREMPIDFVKSYNSAWWIIGVVSAIACASGDTFASELGPVLPLSQPYLITSLQRVPKGTNGGISVAGTFASCLGGLVVGVAFYLSVILCVDGSYLEYSAPQWPIIPVCTIAGLLGSMIDSLLGATLQYSGQTEDGYIVQRPDPKVRYISGSAILDNHAINFLSTLFTSILVPRIARYIWWLVFINNQRTAGPSSG